MQAIQKSLSKQYQAACLAELQALKPGNVHMFADGHGMRIEDFLTSAEVSSEAISSPNASVGERIYNAVDATFQAVGLNTNLGIILLAAPMMQAFYLCHQQLANSTDNPHKDFKYYLQQVLSTLTVQDAVLAAQAIVLANPAGLSQVKAHDVRDTPTVTLQAMMQAAQMHDKIAWQYVHGFADIIDIGISAYQDGLVRWQNTAWATTWVYIHYLTAFLDTHVTRKYSLATAQSLLAQAQAMQSLMLSVAHPKLIKKELLTWDAQLKAQKINPGTSADLTVATLLMLNLM